MRCQRCGKQLTREESIKQKHGPVCIKFILMTTTLNMHADKLFGLYKLPKSRKLLLHKKRGTWYGKPKRKK